MGNFGKGMSVTKRLPLKGRTILVTQAQAQSKRFTTLLKQKGATVLHCPTIEIIPLESKETTAFLKNIFDYDWLVFMSQNAVYYFFEQLKKHKIRKQSLQGCRIAAIGKITREALKQHKLRVNLTPSVYQSESLAVAFKGTVDERKFLILSSLNGRTVLKEGLEKRGAVVNICPLYKTVVPVENAKILLKYICEERIDAVTFTSPSTFENFLTMLNPDHQRYLRIHLETLTIATLGDVTAKAVEDRGLRVRVRPSEFTIPSFVNTLSREL